MLHNLNFKIASSLALTALFALGGQSAFAQGTSMDMGSSMQPMTGNQVKVQVMNHLCNPSIKNIDDFKALEAGRDPVSALANTVLNCPTTGLPGNAAVAGTVASPRMAYDFSITGEHSQPQMLSSATYMPHKICESDVNKDVNGDGMIATSTCLDISHYEFPNVMADNGKVMVTETNPVAGYHFGTLRFTPTVLDGNNDRDSFLATDAVQGRIQLDMTNDKDKTIMLHVYNFVNATSTSSSGMSSSTGSMDADRGTIIGQIRTLQQEISDLFAQIQHLLNKLQ